MANLVQIFLDNHSGTYYPGQPVNGRVECIFSEARRVRAIRVTFEGKAHTRFIETETYFDDFFKEDRTRDVTYSDDEVYFVQEYSLVGGSSEFTIPAGRHTYPIAYILPQHLPSSFEGDNGSVRYTVKVTVDCSWRGDLIEKVGFNVVSPLDLNFVRGVRDPVALSADKTMCSCWCNDSGELTFNVSLPVMGYTSGQEVRIGAHVENLTNVSAEKVQFNIVKTIEYIAHTPRTSSQRYEFILASCTEGGIGAHGEKSWTSVLTIPVDDEFPNLLPCNIIKITYNLDATVVVPFPHTNLRIDMPLLIGNVPLADVDTGFPLGPPAQPNGYAANATAPPPDSPPSAPYPFEGNPPYPAAAASAPHPPPTDGWSLTEPSKAEDFVAPPPSYDEAQQLIAKSGKPT